MQSIFSEEKSTQDREAEVARERELAAVEINPADVELVASEVAAPLHTPASYSRLLPPSRRHHEMCGRRWSSIRRSPSGSFVRTAATSLRPSFPSSRPERSYIYTWRQQICYCLAGADDRRATATRTRGRAERVNPDARRACVDVTAVE